MNLNELQIKYRIRSNKFNIICFYPITKVSNCECIVQLDLRRRLLRLVVLKIYDFFFSCQAEKNGPCTS